MKVFDRHMTDRITVRDKDNYITNVQDCNRLSIDEQNPKFDEEFKKVIIDDGVPDADNNNVVDTPEMFDSYITWKLDSQGAMTVSSTMQHSNNVQ